MPVMRTRELRGMKGWEGRVRGVDAIVLLVLAPLTTGVSFFGASQRRSKSSTVIG